MITPEQIEIAKANGLTNVEALAIACTKHDLPFHYGCAILQKETGGRNIYGHDLGGIFATLDGSNIEVTEANFAWFLHRLAMPKSVSNGVGPMQITYKGHFPIMARLGLKPWVPADNIDYGVGLVAASYHKALLDGRGEPESFQRAATIYNLGSWSETWPYGIDAVAKAATWLKLLTPQGELLMHSNQWDIDYVRWRNGNVATVSRDVCLAIPSPVYLSQGGLSFAGPSANTHAGIGAYDISVKGWSKAKVDTLCRELARSGEAPFPRGGLWKTGFFVQHVHVVSSNVPRSALHPEARAQLDDYRKKMNGLQGASRGKYVGPWLPLGTWKDSPYNPANLKPFTDNNVFYSTVDNLLGLDIDRVQKEKKRKGDRIAGVRQVHRWGRWNLVTVRDRYFSMDYLTDTKPEV